MDEENRPEMEDELDNVIVLTDENGEEVQFEFLDEIEYEDENYVVLLPVDQMNEEEIGEVMILKVEESESDTEESYVGVDDEETLDKVFSIFKEKFQDDYNYVEDDDNN
jgi:uncharacterized protein YrzB (UPF0473 family)